MNTTDWPQAPPVFPCMDRWPNSSLTEHKRALYENTQKNGQISNLNIVYRGTIAIVRYMSACPHAWFLQTMREIAKTTPEQITLKELKG